MTTESVRYTEKVVHIEEKYVESRARCVQQYLYTEKVVHVEEKYIESRARCVQQYQKKKGNRARSTVKTKAEAVKQLTGIYVKRREGRHI
jgi:hypothetical protein